MPARITRITTSSTLHGAIALALLLVAFLWSPISNYNQVFYSSADLLQDFSLTRVEPGFQARNKLMSDEITEMQPWALFNRDELLQGRFPLWNTWNGAGCPHFANYQSAVFSPFNVPYYLLDTKAGLLASTFLKLYACGLFTFLFLKRLRLRQLPALLGASAFMFGGHNILLVSFPHVGAQAVLPAALWCAEIALQRFELWARSFVGATPPGTGGPFSKHDPSIATQERPDLRAPLAGLALVLGIGLLAGQPEVFYFSFLVVATWIAARLVRIGQLTRGAAGAWKRLVALAGKFCFAGIVGAGMSIVQLWPFFEFLENSRLYEQRSLVQTPLVTKYWPLILFPNAIGNPSQTYNLAFDVPAPNYELVNMAYIGGLVVFLALVSLWFARRDKVIVFFAVGAAAWAFYAYDLFGAARWFALIPTVDMAPMNRSQGVWLFCLAVLAACALDHVLRGATRARFAFPIAMAVAALVFLFVFLRGADQLIEEYATYESPNHKFFSSFVPPHVEWMTTLLLAGVAAAGFAWMAGTAWVRGLAGLVVLGCAYLQSGDLLRDYNPVTENRLFYPVTSSVHELVSRVGDDRLAILGEDKLPPDVNLVYRLETIDNYDGMWVRHFDHLYRDQFGDTHNWRPIVKASQRALKMFGVQWVLAKWGWNYVDSGFNPLNREAGLKFTPHEIVPGGTATQTFKVFRPGLSAVAMVLSTYPRAKNTHLDVRIEEVDTKNVVFERRYRVEEIQSTVYSSGHIAFPNDYKLGIPGRQIVFQFPSRADSAGKQYRITLSSDDGRPGTCAYAWSAPVLAYGNGESRWADKPLKGELLFDYSTSYDRFDPVARIGDYVLYRYKDALPFAWAVSGAVVAETDEEALALLRVTNFDPAKIVVLSADETLSESSRAKLGPVDNSKRRLVKFEGDDKVYVVEEATRRLVHVQNEVVFLINKFRWDAIQTVDPSEFDGWTRTFEDIQAQVEAGLRVVVPEVRGQEPLKIVSRTPTHIRMHLDRLWPTYAVVSQAWFPGWKAYVNGEEVPVWRANYAFDAIAVPAGSNDIELVYQPTSVRMGALLSIASLVIGALSLRRRFSPAAVA